MNVINDTLKDKSGIKQKENSYIRNYISNSNCSCMENEYWVKYNNMLSDISLANIEALASGELTSEGWVCFENIHDDRGSFWVIVVWYGNCSSYSATNGTGNSRCWFNQ